MLLEAVHLLITPGARESGQRSLPACPSVSAASDTLLAPAPHELDQTDGADPEELEGVPDENQDHQVEPAGAAVVDDRGADRRGVEVDPGEQHRGDAPLEAASGADGVEQQVGGCVAEYAIASCAERHGRAEHCGSVFLVIARRVSVVEAAMNRVPREGPSRRTRVVC